ncbi:Endonuclease-reverse transcriptase [Popillia japonica]|uniref:Endonuclease-reverse transcriptase n=1 Tax=Popillia japonica TaxID=7064 RepID=A0AAW1JFZ2_POPJA
MELSVYYQNVRGLRTKTNQLYAQTLDAEYNIIAFTETFLNGSIYDNELFHNRYTVHCRDRESTNSEKFDGGGVLLAIRDDIIASAVPELCSDAEDVWVLVRCMEMRFLVCCVYLPPGDVVASQSFLTNLVRVAEEYPDKPLLILGDFNLPHITWFSSNHKYMNPFSYSATDAIFIDTFDYCNLMQFNPVTNVNNRILDFVLASDYIVGSVQVCQTPLLKVDFHHPPLDVCLRNLTVTRSHTVRNTIRYFGKANYQGINEKLADLDWVATFRGLDLEHTVNTFYNTLYSLINKYVPLKTVTRSRFPLWFSQSTIKISNRNHTRVKSNLLGGVHGGHAARKRPVKHVERCRCRCERQVGVRVSKS